MKKLLLITIVSVSISFVADAQTIKENIDKAIKDPKRIENEAKADVYIHQNKIDSVKAKELTARKEKKKKKHCKK